MYAAIRIRGPVNVHRDINDTIRMLNLTRINHCTLLPATPPVQGMLKKVQNFVTWGEIDRPVLELLISKRGRLPGNARLSQAEINGVIEKIEKEGVQAAAIKPVFRLSPPSHGHKPIKQMYPRGACGYRGAAINMLLKRMI